jgi:glycosyltransferase involved in cell wall biosynthesis
MVKLSAVVITFNEEKNIGRCLDSLLPIADEIVVVDSLSTDKTRSICEQKGVRFVEHTFEGYIEQKNYAITQATHNFVLSIDADESLSEELQKSILEVKTKKHFDGYTMNRLTNYCGKWIRHCGWYPDTKLRLWDSSKGKWGGINPHDKFIMNENSKIKHLKGDLLHYSYYTLEDHYKQINHFNNVSAQAMFAKGIRSNSFKLYFHPLANFIKGYILKFGFLDGKAGLTICRLSGWGVYKKYKLLKSISNLKK